MEWKNSGWTLDDFCTFVIRCVIDEVRCFCEFAHCWKNLFRQLTVDDYYMNLETNETTKYI